MNLVIGAANNYAQSTTLWNLALNEHNGPKTADVGGCTNCRGLVTVPTTAQSIKDVIFSPEYYALAHASRFVPRGAVRVGVVVPQAVSSAAIYCTAFVVPGKNQAVVLLANWGASNATFSIQLSGSQLTSWSMPPGLATLIWPL